MLKVWDGMDSLANLMAAMDQCGMTCARSVKKAPPEAEDIENMSHGDRKSEAGMMSKDIPASSKQDGHTDNLPAAEEVEELSHPQHRVVDSEPKDGKIKTFVLS